MKKYLLTSITAIAIACPAIATTDIAVGTNPASCTEPVLGTTSGESNLQAKWTANTLNLRWTAPDADNWSTQNGTCTYDAGITVPQTNPSKTGYTFAGWHVKAVANILASLNISIDGNYYYGRGWDPSENNYMCWISLENGQATGGPNNCSDPAFSDIALNEWKTEFSYGTVYGEASCQASLENDMAYLLGNLETAMAGGEQAVMQFMSEYTSIAGQEKGAILLDIFTRYSQNQITYDQASVELNAKLLSSDNNTQYNKNTTGQYCFCKATNYTPLNGSKQSVAASRWVFDHASDSAANCARYCADDCADYVRYDAGFRAAVFGAVAQ